MLTTKPNNPSIAEEATATALQVAAQQVAAGVESPQEAAHLYAAQGFPVFPCHERGERAKAPRIHQGFKQATTDPTQINAWWEQWPNALIGLPTPPGVLVLDLDAPEAILSLEELNGGLLPATLTASTGRGIHLYYATNLTGIKQSRPTGRDGQPIAGIDLKPAGKGYLIAPPSLHPSTLKPYKWVNTTRATPLPSRLAAACRPNTTRPRSIPVVGIIGSMNALDGLQRTVAHATPGQRNQILYWAACRMRDREQAGHYTDWEGLANAALTSGLTREEILRTIHSAQRTRAAA